MAAVKSATDLPVRLKLRLGWDEEHITAPTLIRCAEELGFQYVTLHGRTRSQMYRGPVNVPAIRQICDAASIPLLANGGVTCAEDALAFLRQTGAAGVAIGRAALKQPWIFDDIARLRRGERPLTRNAPERISVLLRLAKLSCDLRPERVAICEMRKFCSWILPVLSHSGEVLRSLNDVVTLDGFTQTLEDYLGTLARRNDLGVHPELAPDPTLDTVADRRG